jgi:flagellar hook-basal body complex protein FliE
MTTPIGGFGNFYGTGLGLGGGVDGRRQPLGLDIAGERSPGRPGAAGTTEGTSFGDTLKDALGQVSAAQDNAADQMQRFVRGEPVELHQVMAATEEAGIAVEMLIEIRNKFTEAYRAVMSMQS